MIRKKGSIKGEFQVLMELCIEATVKEVDGVLVTASRGRPTYNEIAESVGVSKSTVQRIVNKHKNKRLEILRDFNK